MRSVTVFEIPAATTIIDVREPDEFAAGHAPNAINIPMGEIPSRLADLSASDDDDLYIMCERGGRSERVCTYLAHQGIEAINVDGGMSAWRDAGFDQAH